MNYGIVKCKGSYFALPDDKLNKARELLQWRYDNKIKYIAANVTSDCPACKRKVKVHVFLNEEEDDIVALALHKHSTDGVLL